MMRSEGTSDKRISRPSARVVASQKEKEAAAKRAEHTARKHSRKRAEAAKKKRFSKAPVPARVQSPLATELLDEETDMPVLVAALAPTDSEPLVISPPPTQGKPSARIELRFQLYAYVGTTKVYKNAGQIIMASFDYARENVRADAAARKYACQMDGDLGKRTAQGSINIGSVAKKDPLYSKPLDDQGDWKELDVLVLMVLMVLNSTLSKNIQLDWEMK